MNLVRKDLRDVFTTTKAIMPAMSPIKATPAQI